MRISGPWDEKNTLRFVSHEFRCIILVAATVNCAAALSLSNMAITLSLSTTIVKVAVITVARWVLVMLLRSDSWSSTETARRLLVGQEHHDASLPRFEGER